MNISEPLHELHFDPRKMGFVIVPLHANEEGAGCGWSGSVLNAKERAALAKAVGVDDDADPDALMEMIDCDGEILADGETYRRSTNGHICIVESWCIFHNPDVSVWEMAESAKWLGPDAGTIRVASIIDTEYDDGPVIHSIGPLKGSGTSGNQEGQP